jgi:hypothetical protein
MTPEELYAKFRVDMNDVELPYLWSADEVWSYADDAYSMFARLTGGIPDASSAVTSIAITAGQARSPCSPLILKVRDAYLDSTKRKLHLKNVEDTPLIPLGDYGSISGAADHQPGEVRAMVIGEEEGSVRWIGVPTADDVAKLTVFRLPVKRINEDSSDTDLDEIHYRHHLHLLLWMKHLAYSKQDAETYDKGRAEEFRVAFETYCYRAAAESARQRHKNRVISYGGL